MSADHSPTRVWDLPTRLFHWTLVVLIALQFATAEFGFLSMEWHYRFGWTTLALIVFRIIWGFVGSQTSRFADFVRGPAAIVRYVKAMFSGDASVQVGHNPLGGWSVLAMLACVLVQAISGLFTSDGIDEDGPFVDAVSSATVKLATTLHHLGETALIALIALHVAAVVLHWAVKRDNLVAPMITGKKRIGARASMRFASTWLALAILAIVAVGVVLLSRAGG